MDGQSVPRAPRPDEAPSAPAGLGIYRATNDWEAVSRLLAFVREVFEARSPAVAGQLTASALLAATDARSCRVLVVPLARATGVLDTVAVANRPGVSSLSGTGFVFETVDLTGSVARVVEGQAVVRDGDVVNLPLVARDRVVAVAQLAGPVDEIERALAYTPPAALALEAAGISAERVQRERESRALAELSRLIGGTLDLGSILERTVSFACRSVNLERGILALFDEVADGMAVSRSAFFHGFGGDSGPMVTLSRESFERLVVQSKPVVLNDVRASRRSMAAGPRQLGAESFL
ncbi:MAG TPA: hypothetical protein VHN99_06960, partial [Deinococcales bacterium]|nr:hypothetical protein [Deinococcales bacterium]